MWLHCFQEHLNSIITTAAFALHRAGVNKPIWILSGSMVSQFPGKHRGSWWCQPVSSWALLMWAQCCSAKPIVELALVATPRLAGDKGWGEWSSCFCTMVRFSRRWACGLLVEVQRHEISDSLFCFSEILTVCLKCQEELHRPVFCNQLWISVDLGGFSAYLGLVG